MGEIICPLFTTNTMIDENSAIKIDTQRIFCIEEQCAWWIEDKQKCAIAVGGERNRGK